MIRRYAIAVIVAAAAGIAIGVAVHVATTRAASPPLDGQATWGAGERPAPEIALNDQNARRVSLASLRGRTVVLAFMDSLCRTACPLEGRMLAAAFRRLTPNRRPALIVVSVDPKDTPQTVAAVIEKRGLPNDTRWVLGTRAELERVWRRYHITVDPSSGDIVHSTAIYLIDKHGDERAGFLMPFLPNLVAGDLRRLAA